MLSTPSQTALLAHSRNRKLLLLLTLCFTVLFTSRFQAATVKFSAKLPRTRYLAGEQGQIKYTETSRITYKFKSSDKSVFKVSKKGVITARAAGTATLTITGTWKKDSREKTWTKQVKLQVYSCKLSKTSISLSQSKSKTLTIKGETLTRRIKWESETPFVCSVTDGKVKGLTEGTGYVHAKVGSQVVLRCQVTVTATALKTFSAKLLVNSRHIYGSVDLANEFYKEACNGKKITYSVSNNSLGKMVGNIYYANAYGANTVTAYCGAYKKVYRFTQLAWSAHRGYNDMYPENTIDAFEGAALAGAGYIETDVRVTKDGELVLMHDNKLGNMTNSDAAATVAKLTLSEIRALVINNGNNLAKLQCKQVPTLEEYLQVCRRYGVVAIIEIKTLGKTAQQEASARKIVDLLAKNNMTSRAMVISFYPSLLKIFRDVAGPAIPIAPCNADYYSTLVSYNMANIYKHHSLTPLGYEVMYDYSPLVGRKNAAPSAFHSRV